MNSGAKFNENRTHRIYLWRIWDESLPLVLFIGLNPSKANEVKPDNTITRLFGNEQTGAIGFAHEYGFGGGYMMNLFSIVSSKPKVLLNGNSLVDGYDDELKNIAAKCSKVIFCWGGFSEAKKRQHDVIEMFPDALCFGHNADGTPKHPLYLKSSTQLIQFKPESV